MKIFPNPAQDILWLQLNEAAFRPHKVTVYDTAGHSCDSYELPNDKELASIPVSNLKPGAYFLQIEHENDDCIKPFLVMR